MLVGKKLIKVRLALLPSLLNLGEFKRFLREIDWSIGDFNKGLFGQSQCSGKVN